MTPEAWLGFRLRLRARLLEAAGVSSVGLVLAAACGGRAESGSPNGGSVGGTSVAGANRGGASLGGNAPVGGMTPSAGQPGAAGAVITLGGKDAGPVGEPAQICVALGAPGSGGQGGSSTGGSQAGSGGGQASGEAGLGGALGGGGARGENEPDAPAQACLEAAQAIPLLERECTKSIDGISVVAVKGGPFVQAGQCCYDLLVAYSSCGYVGRAFLVDGDMIKARARKGASWSLPLSPCVQPLSSATRRALAEAWIKDGLFEHASVATFSRFAIQLMSVGAPARLLHDTLAAGRDEVRHAELCFALASAYAGEPLEPDAFPVDAKLSIDRELTAIVAETVVEGCIGETLAALQARAQLDVTTDPAVRAALEATVEDETRHAELAWKVVAWAVQTGGAAVRSVVERTFNDFRPPPAPELALDDVDLRHFAEHGRLTPEQARAVAFEALETVVKPCAAGLLEQDVFERAPCTAVCATPSGPVKF